MKYILFPEGRILNNNGTYEYEYHLKDHLGSVRVAFVPTVNGKEVVQENAYYPFGATIADLSYAAPLNNNRYGYTGQEQLNDFDLNWYDYIARNYNPLIGRFNSIDPLAEKYYGISPYAYCANNPVRFVDPDGREIRISFRTGFLGLGGKESLRYESGVLYNEDGSVSEHQSKQRGFLKKTVNALDNLGSGKAGSELIGTLESSKRIYTVDSGDNTYDPKTRTVSWNPSNRQSEQSNVDGSTGRSPFIGLGHELGHAWDHNENGLANLHKNAIWYTTAEGKPVRESEKFSTWWENRIRTEHGEPLRGGYSYDASTTPWKIEPQGSILVSGTRNSSVINIFGKPIPSGPINATSPLNMLRYMPYKY